MSEGLTRKGERLKKEDLVSLILGVDYMVVYSLYNLSYFKLSVSLK